MGRVQLAVSPLGGIPGATAYHTSVVVDGEEFSFSNGGVSRAHGPRSHSIPGKAPRIIDMGTSTHSGDQMLAKLEPHFRQGTYDLLRKNCNSFSDCALYFLVQQRLNPEYRTLERMGGQMPGLVQAVARMGGGGGSGGAGPYTPNAQAADFDLEALIRDLDPEKHWRTPGQATGGTPAAATADSLRAARLARFGGGLTPGAASQGGPPAPGGRPAAGTEGDEEMARRLQAEEDERRRAQEAPQRPPLATPAGMPPGPGPSRPSPVPAAAARRSPSTEGDAAMARRLQAEEEARATRERAAPGRSAEGARNGRGFSGGSPSGSPGGNPLEVLQQMNGLLQALGQTANAGAMASGGGRGRGLSGSAFPRQPARSMDEVVGQIGTQVERLGAQLAQVQQHINANSGPTGQLNLQFQQLAQALEQAVGSAGGGRGRPGTASRGASDQEVAASTTLLTYEGPPAGGASEADRQCMVCLENFRAGEELRVLPCLHRFHKECIDPWLRRNCQCPTCNHRFGHDRTISI